MNKFSMALFVAVSGMATMNADAQTIINFDDGRAGDRVNDFYASLGLGFDNATFASASGVAGASGSLAIFSNAGSMFGEDNPITGTFANVVSRISIRALDVGAAGATLETFDAQNTRNGLVTFTGVGIGVGAFQDLEISGAEIKSFKLYQVNRAANPSDGMAFDNLAFTVAVPEPATWAMMLVGFGMVGGAARYRRRATKIAYA